MIYIDLRQINVQGFGIPHGGGLYSSKVLEIFKINNIQYRTINFNKDLLLLKEDDTLISASCYDLLYRKINCKKYYIFHGLRDEELYALKKMRFLSSIKFSLRKLIKKIDISNTFLIFPSQITFIAFQLYNNLNLNNDEHSIIACPSSDADKISLTSNYIKNLEINDYCEFLILNADREVKNFNLVIEATKYLHNKEYKIFYTSKNKLTNKKNFHHIEYCSSNELKKLRENKVLLFPSLSEGYGIPLAENNGYSIISGILTLTYEHSSKRTIIINPFNPLELASAMSLFPSYSNQEKIKVDAAESFKDFVLCHFLDT